MTTAEPDEAPVLHLFNPVMHSRYSIAALAATLFIGLALSGCDSASPTGAPAVGPIEASAAEVDLSQFDSELGADNSVDLIGGKNTKVGTVTIVEAAGGYSVTYNTLPGYCITEWHLDVGRVSGDGSSKSDFVGIPLAGKGNPKNGKFMYGGDGDCLTTIPVFVSAGAVEAGSGDIIFAAHAVVVDDPNASDEDCNFIYGIASDGNIYKISLGDVSAAGDESESLLFATGLESDAVAATWPNSLAFDAVSNRLYYSNAENFNRPVEGSDDSAPLYFFDFSTGRQTHAGDLTRRSASGTFEGGFWYVPQNLDDNLRLAAVDGAGQVVSDDIACEDFTGDLGNTPMFFGDIVFNPADGLIYGSARFQPRGDGASTFFTVDPTSCAYTVRGTGLELSQLTLDCQGNLIGFNTDRKEYLLIDPVTGSQTVIGTSEYAINDLAPGRCDCESVGEFDETAWGAGPSFPGNNWSMYIPFTAQ